MTAKVLLVGPIPPPVDGRAVATSWLVANLRDRDLALRIVDTQLDGRLMKSRKAARCVVAAWSILRSPPDLLIVVASGNLGLLAEVVPVLLARLRRRPVVLMHHVASYVRKRYLPLQFVIAAGRGRITHVVLGDQMRREMTDRYRLDPSRCVVLNNAALMPHRQRPTVERQRRVIHLANLSAEKGSLVSIEVARQLGSTEDQSNLCLAGPARAEIRTAIDRARAEGVDLDELGPVADEAKFLELAMSRVLLFPTTYVNEAQPLVVYEAASMGVVPVVWSTGWIAEQMESLGLARFVFAPGDIGGIVDASRALLSMPDHDFDGLAAQVQSAFDSLVEQARAQLDQVLP